LVVVILRPSDWAELIGRRADGFRNGSSARIIVFVQALVILTCFGLATGIIGKAKGSSFWIWFGVGFVLPLLGLIAVILYRVEKDEPERRCPRCGSVQKLYVQVCNVCGEELYLPDPSEVRHPQAG
jgi:hypothetical protein